MINIAYLPATTLVEKIRQREISPLDLLDACAAQIQGHNAQLNVIVALDLDRATERALAAEAALDRGESWGPLHGLPMTIKDSYEVVGMPATSGSPKFENHRPEANASAVQRLVDAGAIIFGKTNLPLLAGDWQCYNDLFGTTNNPWDTTRTPGGSSGGAAAALAAGFTPLELGSDIGGSVRIPAHYCGVYGHKPTHGIVPLQGHIPGPPGTVAEPDIAVAGPLARSAADLALMLQVMVGPSAMDQKAWQFQLPPSRHQSLADFRVAYWFDDPLCPISDDIRAEYERLLTSLREAGVTVTEARPADLTLDDIMPQYLDLLGSMMGAAMPKNAYRFMPVTQTLMRGLRLVGRTTETMVNYLRAFTLSHRAWLRTHERREKMRHQVSAFFDSYDVLLTPITPTVAIPHDQKKQMLQRQIMVNGEKRPYTDHLPWIALATALGLPATSAPLAQNKEGLPINIQIVGGSYEDATTIKFAEMLESVHGGFVAPPLLKP